MSNQGGVYGSKNVNSRYTDIARAVDPDVAAAAGVLARDPIVVDRPNYVVHVQQEQLNSMSYKI